MDQWSQIPKEWHAQAEAKDGSILLQTARGDAENYRSYLFLDPIQILSTSQLEEIPAIFHQIEQALDAGLHVAGFVGYECGYHFQPAAGPPPSPTHLPLLWFGVYRAPLIHDHRLPSSSDNVGPITSLEELSDEFDALPSSASLTISEAEYCSRIEEIKDYIRAGDTYQVNFTDSIDMQIDTAPAQLFAALSHRQPVSYSAFLKVAEHRILSFSPELFFRIDDGHIVTRPMKGTMPRGRDSIEDIEAAVRLRNDEKNRAEHVMIVDLLRNDLGRICTMGSVTVDDLFSVERYSTLLQMTSTISGTLRSDLGYYDIFKSMFPCGSITGAPKIRTMQLIRELEQRPRELYTGAIGFISPNRSSVFNVAIRTLSLNQGRARMGVGGGIVADSIASDEYQECLLKASFLTQPRPSFQLIETMLWDQGCALLSLHLDRLESSASYFEFSFDRASLLRQLTARADQFIPGERYRVRLLLDSTGSATIAATPHRPDPPTGSVVLSSERTSSADVFLRHKTTHRSQYERLYAEAHSAGFDEILFLNERDEVTEGAISSLFIQRGGKLFTPPLSSGVLPGVFRRHLLETDSSAEERVLHLEDLQSADAIFLCNAVRGMRRIDHLCLDPSCRTNEVAAI